MNEFLIKLLGEEVLKQLVIILSADFEVLLSIYLFNIKGHYRKKWWLWNLITIFSLILLSVPLAYLRSTMSSIRALQGIVHSLYMFGLTSLLLFITYDEEKFQWIQSLCATHATRIFTAKSLGAILNLTGNDTFLTMSFFGSQNIYLDWTIYYAYHIAIYIIFGFIFKMKNNVSLSKKGKRNISILTIFSVLATDFFYCFVTPYESQSLILSGMIKIVYCFMALMILIIRKEIFYSSNQEQETALMSNLLDKEREQFEKSRENIDIINSKCHDLNHQLSKLEGKITDEELLSLKEATSFYDSTIKTGNDVVDSAIYENQLICQKHNIKLTCMCDGNLLNFMEKTELYSLITNALSNAIKAVENLPDDKRIIDFTLAKKNGIILLEIDNYFDGEIKFSSSNLPISTKTDGKNHGFGSKSISYIVNRYNGTLSYSTDNQIFKLLISF